MVFPCPMDGGLAGYLRKGTRKSPKNPAPATRSASTRARAQACLRAALDEDVGDGEQAAHREPEQDPPDPDPDVALDAAAEDVRLGRRHREPGGLAQRILRRVASALVVDG